MRIFRVPAWLLRALLGLAMPLLAGCLEEEVSIDLREDGSGTAVFAGRLSEEGTRLVAILDEPGGGTTDLHLGPDDFSFRDPGEEARKALEGRGLRITECVARRDPGEVSSRLAVEFESPGALGLVDGLRRREAMEGRPPPVGKPGFELAAAPEGTWTLSFTTPSIQMSGGSSHLAVPGEKTDRAKLLRKMKATRDLAGEALKVRGKVSLRVPGEILEAWPEMGASRGEGRCTWEFDLNALLNMAVRQGWDPEKAGDPLPPVAFRVRFRLPEGRTFPAAPPRAPDPPPSDPGKRERFLAETARVFDVLPRDVPYPERKGKAAEVEGYRGMVASDLPAFLPLLREALREEGRNRWFLFEGARLLADHGSGREDFDLAATAASGVRMVDVGSRAFFELAHRLCREEIDPWPLLGRILREPDFTVSAPGFSLALHGEDAALLCLLANGIERRVGEIRTRFAAEKEMGAACILLHCLSMAATPEADAAVGAVARDEALGRELRMVSGLLLVECAPPPLPAGPPERTREEFEAFLGGAEAEGRLPAAESGGLPEGEALHHVRAADGPRIRALRRLLARRAGDDVLRDVGFLTRLLRRAEAAGR